MENLFLNAVKYGVQLTAGHLAQFEGKSVPEKAFKTFFAIPDKDDYTGYRKHKTFNIEKHIELYKQFAKSNDKAPIIAMINAELEAVNYFLTKALGYKKKPQIEKQEARIKSLEVLKASLYGKADKKAETVKKTVKKTEKPAEKPKVEKSEEKFKYTYDDLGDSGLYKNSRRFMILAAQFDEPANVMKKHELREWVYISSEEFMTLVKLCPEYFAEQKGKAEKTLKNKLKKQSKKDEEA
jgi:hypothetical protein